MGKERKVFFVVIIYCNARMGIAIEPNSSPLPKGAGVTAGTTLFETGIACVCCYKPSNQMFRSLF